jgi:hypothetical protein
MKNAKLILLAIVSISLLNSCGGTSNEPSVTSSPVASSPSLQSNDGSKGTIDPKLLKEYQDSQKKLVALLDKRIVKDSEQNVDRKLRDNLTDELKRFNIALDNIDKTTNKDIQNKIKSFKQIIYFEDLSGKNSNLKNLQGRLKIQLKDIGAEEGKFFGKKTSVALIEEVLKFGQELETYAKATPQPTPLPSTTTPLKPVDSSKDYTWLSTLAAVLSVLSAIGSGIAIYIAKNSTKKTKTNSQHPTRSNNQLSSNLSGNRGSLDRVDDRSFNEVDRLRSEINALRSDLQETKFNYTNLSERFNKLSQQQTNNAASNREDTRFNDDYRKDLNRDQRASTRDRYSVSTPPSPPPQPAWIDEYNQNSRSFYTRYVKAEVLEEEQNIEGRRSGKVLTVNLSIVPQRTGGYWVFDRDSQLMLVPSSEVRINQFNRDTFDDMFDYSEFRSGYRKIVLSQPAIVEPNPAGGYQLVRRGRIEFE